MSLRQPQTKADRSGGFALIEVLVAVAVAGLIMAALLRAFTNIWGGVTAVREDAESMLLARTVIFGVPRNAIVEGEKDGNAGRYHWVMTTTRPQVATPPPRRMEDGSQPPEPAKVYRILVNVTAPGERRTSLETFRIGLPAR